VDSNHSRRPYESRVAPRVVTIFGPGIEPGSLTRWGMSPVGCHCPSLRRPRADSNGKTALRKRSARSPSESSFLGRSPPFVTPEGVRSSSAPRSARCSRHSCVPRRSRTFTSWLRRPAAGSAGRDNWHPVSVSIRFLDFEGVATGAPLAMCHQQSQATVRCAASGAPAVTPGLRPGPHACFAGYSTRTGQEPHERSRQGSNLTVAV